MSSEDFSRMVSLDSDAELDISKQTKTPDETFSLLDKLNGDAESDKLKQVKTPDDNFSLLDNLNGDVQLALLNQLEVREFVNLASVSRKWRNLALTAPRSVKPVFKVDNLTMWQDGFETTINEKRIRIPKNFKKNLDQNQLYKIECKTLTVKRGFLNRKLQVGFMQHAVNYLVVHRDIIKIDEICFKPKRGNYEQPDLLVDLFGVAKRMSVGQPTYRTELPLRQRRQIAKAIEQCVHAEEIFSNVDIPVESIRKILQAVSMGNRPHLKLLRCAYDRRFITGTSLEYLVEGLKDRIVSDQPCDDYDYVLSYSDSHEIELYVDTYATYVCFEIVPKRDRSRDGWAQDQE